MKSTSFAHVLRQLAICGYNSIKKLIRFFTRLDQSFKTFSCNITHHSRFRFKFAIDFFLKRSDLQGAFAYTIKYRTNGVTALDKFSSMSLKVPAFNELINRRVP